MKTLLLAAAFPLIGGAANAQPADPHAGHAGHEHHAPAAPAPADPHAGHGTPTGSAADLPIGSAAPPPTPADDLADRVWSSGMDRARTVLAQEHGGMRHLNGWLDRFEVRPGSGDDAYAWEARLRYGGDINRLVLKTEGEGEFGHGLEEAQVQALWSRAVTAYFDLQAGVRQDLEPRGRTYATVGFEGLAPYWWDVEGALFLSTKGDLSARFEVSHDLRLTNRLILEPSAELHLASQDDPRSGQGSGLTDAELGLRLRYEIRREFAPYVGVHYERKFGDTADYARAAGEDAEETRVVVGLKSWF